MKVLKCGSKSMQNAAMVVAIIDTICTSVLLILFVLGSSLMLAFKISGKANNATRVLDIVTDDVFGTMEESYNKVRANKDVAEDMGVWLIIMFLTIVDFIISCVFLDGVRSRNINKVQTWFNIRIIIIVIFKIIVLINLLYGTSLLNSIPDLIFTIYRVVGLYIGWAYLRELQSPENQNVSIPRIELTPTTPPVECGSFVPHIRKDTPGMDTCSFVYSPSGGSVDKCSSTPSSQHVFEKQAGFDSAGNNGISNPTFMNTEETNHIDVEPPVSPVPDKKIFKI